MTDGFIDAAALGQLRAVVGQLQTFNADGTSLTEVVKLARAMQVGTGITVDFKAVPELGQPLIVVRMPWRPVGRGASLQGLTPRERQVAALIAEGLSNKAIAGRLDITVGTVKHYVHQILDKTGFEGRVAVATGIDPEASGLRAEAPPIFG